jgi:hypothetical protein
MRSSRSLPGIGLSCFTAVLLLSSPAPAEETAESSRRLSRPKAYGVEDYTVTVVPAIAFLPRENDTYTTFAQTMGRRGSINTVTDFYAPIDLPLGAFIDYIGLNTETNIYNIFGVALYSRNKFGDVHTIGTFGSTVHGWDTDYGEFVGAGLSPTVPEALILHVQQGSAPTVQWFGYVEVWWRRGVSLAPSVATFNDVPLGHPFFRFIEALAASGITVGCGSGNYCPEAPLTRGQMAVFLAKALGLHSVPPGPPS